MLTIESPSVLEELSAVKRFFVFGCTDLGDSIHLILVGRYPAQFHGFLFGEPTTERHRRSRYRLFYWKEVLPHLETGDLIFMAERNSTIESEFVAKGVRIARVQNLVQTYGTFEAPTMLHFCKTYIKERGVALDVGGNTGLTGAMLSKFSKHVHIFEANPEMETPIQATNEGNSNITLHMKAVCQTSGSVSIYPAGNHNMSMVPRDKSAPTIVPSITIDDFCREYNVDPTVIKIDVEGVDGDVILGARETISVHKPLIFFEHPLHMASVYRTDLEAVEEAMTFLTEFYDLFAFPHLGQLFPARALNMPLNEFCDEFHDEFTEEHGKWPANVAAVPKS